MRKKLTSIDGFVPRRDTAALGDRHAPGGKLVKAPSSAPRPELGKSTRPINDQAGRTKMTTLSRSEIDESLDGIDDQPIEQPKKGLFRRKKRGGKLPLKKKIRRVVTILLILLLVIGGFLGIKAFLASSTIFKGNLFDIFQNKPLKMDANGRSNILVFGTSEDDPGHEAGSLTDSIMVLSVDQNKKNAYMVSVPRDLHVEYGQACISGNAGKINVLYGCYSNDGQQEEAGADALKGKVGEVLGLDVQYYAHVNYTVVRDVVKSLGGITVTIDSRDPNGQMDSNFDWKCGADYYARKQKCPPNGHFIDYPNGPVKLDAEHALYLAQARGDAAPTYGFEQSNFDREKNQQKIIKAIREKAVSAGTIADVGKVTGLIDALGKNLRTDFATSEIRTLMQLGQDIPSENIKSISLVKEGEEVVTNMNIGGASSVVPIAGVFDYAKIQGYIKKNLTSNPVIQEGASLLILNGSGVAGAAQAESDKLAAVGYTVDATGNAPTPDYQKTVIYQSDPKTMTATAKALARRYNVEIIKTPPSFDIAVDTDFVIVVGLGSAEKTNQVN